MYGIHEDPRKSCHDCIFGKCVRPQHVQWEAAQREARIENFQETLKNLSRRTKAVGQKAIDQDA